MTKEMQTLAFEIGTEEIPAEALHRAGIQMKSLMESALDAIGIEHGDVAVYSSPRRIAAVVPDVAVVRPASEQRRRGPSVKIAFDDSGALTKAGLGFARSCGVNGQDLVRGSVGDIEYVFAVTEKPAAKSSDLLPDALLRVIEGIKWPKSMRWGSRREQFCRPVRWVLALLGSEVISLEFAGLKSGNTTYGHRVLAPGGHMVGSADEYLDVVRGAFVVPSEDERAAAIRQGVARVEANLGYAASLPEKTFLEVVNLCEYPTVLTGQFDPEFLDVPEEIIVDAMLMHQRYFPLYEKSEAQSAEGGLAGSKHADGGHTDAEHGKLTNRFIVVSNGNPAHADEITEGNNRVVRARLDDAKFFFEEDLKHPLEYYVDALDKLVFQEQLGTMRAKTERIVRLSLAISAGLGIAGQDAKDIERAALLAKADLTTNAVVEFTSVQGIMGGYYALASGETASCALAIRQHYMPRFAGDGIPEQIAGRVVAVADKIDTICGLFAVGRVPTGSSDPFGLRRAALGVIAICVDGGLDISIDSCIKASLDIYAETVEFDRGATLEALTDFFTTRCRVSLHDDEGIPADVIDAILIGGVSEPKTIFSRCRALQSATTEGADTFEDLAIAYARANNLRDADVGTGVDASLFTDVEADLDRAVEGAQAEVDAALATDRFSDALDALAKLRGPIDALFDGVMIMDDDEKIRQNRIRLLNKFVSVFLPVADFSKLVRRKKADR